jgi:hypothetical protein
MEIIEITTDQIHFFNAVKHCCIAVARDKESRFALDYLYITKEQIVSSDGHRLHVSENNFFLKPGFYRILRNLSKLILLHRETESENKKLEFPDYKKILKTAAISGTTMSMQPKNSEYPEQLYMMISKLMPEDKSVRFSFTKDAIRYASGMFAYRKNEDMVVFSDMEETKIAVVMTLKW